MGKGALAKARDLLPILHPDDSESIDAKVGTAEFESEAGHCHDGSAESGLGTFGSEATVGTEDPHSLPFLFMFICSYL